MEVFADFNKSYFSGAGGAKSLIGGRPREMGGEEVETVCGDRDFKEFSLREGEGVWQQLFV